MGFPLLHRVAVGQPAAMQDCINSYGGLVWSIARRFTRTNADAEDATQDIFLEIWRHAGRFDHALGSEQVFIATIARRRLIDRLRKTQAEPMMETSAAVLEAVALTTDETVESGLSVDSDQAVRAMAALRPEYRRVLELGFLHGLTHSEIAKGLNMPLGTVKSCMRRGLIQVRNHLQSAITPTAAVAIAPARTRRTKRLRPPTTIVVVAV